MPGSANRSEPRKHPAEPFGGERERVALVPAERQVRAAAEEVVGIGAGLAIRPDDAARRQLLAAAADLHQPHPGDRRRREVEAQRRGLPAREPERDGVGAQHAFLTAERGRLRLLLRVPARPHEGRAAVVGGPLREVPDPADVVRADQAHHGDAGVPGLLDRQVDRVQRADLTVRPTAVDEGVRRRVLLHPRPAGREDPAEPHRVQVAGQVDDAVRVHPRRVRQREMLGDDGRVLVVGAHRRQHVVRQSGDFGEWLVDVFRHVLRPSFFSDPFRLASPSARS